MLHVSHLVSLSFLYHPYMPHFYLDFDWTKVLTGDITMLGLQYFIFLSISRTEYKSQPYTDLYGYSI